MGLLIFYFVLTITVSFLCSIWEAVLLSITPSFVESQHQKGGVMGKKLRQLKEDVDKPLAAILSLNTIAHTVGAAGVGAQAAIVLKNIDFGIISGVLTLLILVFSELIPKSLGANYWRNLAGFTAYSLNFIQKPMIPFIYISKLITRLMAKKGKEASISRAEMSAMAEIGRKEGVFEEGESRVIKNLLKFKSVKVEDVMTPRTVVVAVQEDTQIGSVYENRETLRVSRIPVYKENRDDMTGFVHKHDLLDKMAKNESTQTMKDIKRIIMAVSEEMPVPMLFEKFIAKKEHIALVMDKYGGVSGIVTMEDVLETLLGIEIVDEFDSTQDMQVYAKEKWASKTTALNAETTKKK